MKFPCSKKCLKYPICKYARMIDCPDLLKYFEDERNKSDADSRWKIIRNTLPNLVNIKMKDNVYYGFSYVCTPDRSKGTYHDSVNLRR